MKNQNNELTNVCDVLRNAANDSIPVLNRKRRKALIHDTHLKQLCRQSKKAWRQWRDAGRPTAGPLYEEKKEYKKEIRKYCQSCRARAERKVIQHRDELFRKNDKHRFKAPTKRSVCRKLVVDGEEITNPSEIVCAWRQHFQNLANSQGPNSEAVSSALAKLPSLETLSYSTNEMILDVEITEEEVTYAIQRLKLGKAAGHDGISSEHLRFGGQSLVKWLVKVFNSVLTHEQIPDCLKVGVIVPIYKGRGKDPLNPSSYRGITLSSTIGKVLELIILQRMVPILEDFGFPHRSQTAYQSGLSCIDAIYFTQEAVLKHMREGGKPYLCLYDVEKAFDSLEVPILLTNIFNVGVNGKCWRLIKSWYDRPTCCVKHDSLLSEPFVVGRGIKQGSVLSPSLFLVVMDILLRDLSQKSLGLSVHNLYVGSGGHADDIRTTATNKSSLMS